MEFDIVISKRKSVRSYLERHVSQVDIESIIMAGNKAPAACGLSASGIIVIREERDKKEIVKTTYRGSLCNYGQVQSWMMEAPVFLVIYMDIVKCRQKYGEDDYKKTAYLNASAVIQNMLLKAVDLGLASCYVTGFRENELAEFLNMDKNKEVIAILTLGYEQD